MAIYKSALDLVGKTPLLEVKKNKKEKNSIIPLFIISNI